MDDSTVVCTLEFAGLTLPSRQQSAQPTLGPVVPIDGRETGVRWRNG